MKIDSEYFEKLLELIEAKDLDFPNGNRDGIARLMFEYSQQKHNYLCQQFIYGRPE